MSESIQFNETKFKELLLYAAGRCEEDPRCGSTKLNKILFFSDFYAYGLTGQPITGAEYKALERGPAPRFLLPIRQQMEENGELVLRKMERFGREQHRVLPLREPDLSMFSGAEIAIVNDVIENILPLTGKDISELTHGLRGWQIARPQEEIIPYETVFLSDDAPTKADHERAKELALQHGWT